ncbi:uncharacterized protein LOC110856332 isoform X1 [Folsomia candida]|uniref:uncharacterized protein LOC110856332 isoform X1 n=1 Tax=Folsomia candida TaxID=158441 RepID=UPI0016051FDC|nr:uncharacterized protein LOC110856332 isoform X1 [Folsomia candida]
MFSLDNHHVMQTEEEVEPLDQIDQAASDRILELFATPYPELTRAQVLMLERIVAATKVAQLPYSLVFQPDNVLYDDTMDIDDDISLASIVIPRCEPLADLAPYIYSTRGRHSTGHTTPNSVADKMRGMWNTYFENARGYDEGHVYDDDDVLEFVDYMELFMDDPAVGMPLNTLRGGECHVLYDHKRQFFILHSIRHRFLLCMTPGCFRLEGEHVSVEFPHCFRHYNTEVHVVLEITRVHDNDDKKKPKTIPIDMFSSNFLWIMIGMMQKRRNIYKKCGFSISSECSISRHRGMDFYYLPGSGR